MGCESLDWMIDCVLTDTHCHLNLTIFQEDLDETLARAWEQGVEKILVPGVDLETSRLALRLCEQHENLYAAVGVHPGDAGGWTDASLSSLRELARHPKTVAIGEIGLDYYRDRAPRPLQRSVFRAQLELAGELCLPVIIHNRESFADLWQDVTDWQDQVARHGSNPKQSPGVFHSFDGTLDEAQQIVEKGFFIGISGPVTYRNAHQKQEIGARIRLEHILTETDAPYLTPHPFRGRRNEPAYVALVAEKLAGLQGVAVETAAQVTGKNADKLFHWGANP